MKAPTLCCLALLCLECAPPTDSVRIASPTAEVAQPAPVANCAEVRNGAYFDRRLNTSCTFRFFQGVRVCFPDNAAITLGGVCDSAGGKDRLWISREPNCLGDGTSNYVLTLTQRGVLNCDDLRGIIETVADFEALDQRLNVYDPEFKTCTPSFLSGNHLHPVVDIAPPPAPRFVDQKGLPLEVCK